jgi:hypothetical protein
MAQMNCCGVDGYEDFRTARLFVQKSSTEGLGRQVLECNGDLDTFLAYVTHLSRFLSPAVFSLVILSYSVHKTPPASSAPHSLSLLSNNQTIKQSNYLLFFLLNFCIALT